MRLLNTDTFQLELFMGKKKPQYAILSHTWEPDEEITFEDVNQGLQHLQASTKKGLSKLQSSAKCARESCIKYIWIDTCCIDKRSSAELSEAINSMFNWYRDSTVCYAFLADYNHAERIKIDHEVYCTSYQVELFTVSRWFTRGWTLQELIAPAVVDFYDNSWTKFGTREDLAYLISQKTSIDTFVLTRRNLMDEEVTIREALADCSISKKMMWAANRETTRPEDIAYCLLGIFDVNMPLLYGEGEHAFQRLQEQIALMTHDQTLLTWHTYGMACPRGIFAPSPAYFKDGGRFRPVPRISERFLMAKTNMGLEVDVYLAPCTIKMEAFHAVAEHGDSYIAVLSCSDRQDDFACVGLLLYKTDFVSNSFARIEVEKVALYHVTGPLLIRHGASTAALPVKYRHETGNPAPGYICFDPTELKYSRILLHVEQKKDPDVSMIEHPRAMYDYPSGLSYFEKERIAPVDATYGRFSGSFAETLPAMLPGDGCELIYGAASFYEESGDGFFLLWGFTTDWDEFLLNQGDWWICDKCVPFCEVFRTERSVSLKELRYEDDDAIWVRELIKWAYAGDDGITRSRSNKLADGKVFITWVNDINQTVKVTASLRKVEFLGRHKCKITVDVEVK